MKLKGFIILCLAFIICDLKAQKNLIMENKMKIDVWSDVACPFCYIGKKNMEKALQNLGLTDSVNITWKSFQLVPDLVTDTSVSIDEFLAKHKGMPIEQVKQMNEYVTQKGSLSGIDFKTNKITVANTFMAHNFIHFAHEQNKQNEAKEKLLYAYFTLGLNVDDISVLLELGNDLGFKTSKLKEVLENKTYSEEISSDIKTAREIGVTGVPFFVINQKYALSGAQEVKVFEQQIAKAYKEWKENNPYAELNITPGETCKPDGTCD